MSEAAARRASRQRASSERALHVAAASGASAARAVARRDTGLRAFVLHRWDWSESSLILDLFTRDGGRVVAAAKGAKRPSSSLRPVLLPFQPLQVLLSRRHADDEDEVLTLRGAEWAGDLAGDLVDGSAVGSSTDDPNQATATLLRGQALFLGFYVNELLIELLPRGDPHPVLFDAYAQTLAALASSRVEARTQAALRAFELVLLKDLGWLADLSVVTATQAPVLPNDAYALRAEGGLTPTRPDEGIGGEHWLRVHAALADRAFGELRHACEHDAAAPLRVMLRHVLALNMGRGSLRTRDVALGLRRLARA